jgi:hypothetical protein
MSIQTYVYNDPLDLTMRRQALATLRVERLRNRGRLSVWFVSRRRNRSRGFYQRRCIL